MKHEVEDGTVPSGRKLRFGFDPLEFPEFSWRGYAQMTSLQPVVVALSLWLSLTSPSLSAVCLVTKSSKEDLSC